MKKLANRKGPVQDRDLWALFGDLNDCEVTLHSTRPEPPDGNGRLWEVLIRQGRGGVVAARGATPREALLAALAQAELLGIM